MNGRRLWCQPDPGTRLPQLISDQPFADSHCLL